MKKLWSKCSRCGAIWVRISHCKHECWSVSFYIASLRKSLPETWVLASPRLLPCSSGVPDDLRLTTTQTSDRHFPTWRDKETQHLFVPCFVGFPKYDNLITCQKLLITTSGYATSAQHNSRFATVALHLTKKRVTLSILRHEWSEAHRPLGPHSGLQVGK